MKFRSLLGAGFVLIVLSSCLDIGVDIDIAEASADSYSGTVEITYTMDAALVETGAQDNTDDILTVPVSRRDAERSALTAEGVQLESYRRTTLDDGSLKVVAGYGFDSLSGLSSLLDFPVVPQDGGVRFELPSEDMNEAGVMDSLLLEMIEGKGLAITVTAPASVDVSLPGAADGKTGSVVFSWADLVTGRAPSTWEVRW